MKIHAFKRASALVLSAVLLLSVNAAALFGKKTAPAPAVEGATPAAERSGGSGAERSPRPQGASGGNSGGIMGQLMPQRPRMSRGGAGGAQAMGPGQTRYWVAISDQRGNCWDDARPATR